MRQVFTFSKAGSSYYGTFATHGGMFHADDVVAAFILLRVFPNAKIVRVSRDVSSFEEFDIVFDVGRVFDGEKFFDHHQRGVEPRANGVPYASCGLIFRKFAVFFLAPYADKYGVEDIEAYAEMFDRLFLQAVDAKDNGSFDYRATLKGSDTFLPTLDFNEIVKSLNPDNPKDADEAFLKAVQFVEPIVEKALERAASLVKGEKICVAANTGDAVLVLDRGADWHFAVCEKLSHVKIVVNAGRDGDWLVQPVPQFPGAQSYDTPLPEEWRGLSGAELAKECGKEDVKFCSGSGHLLIAKSRDTAVALAHKALRQPFWKRLLRVFWWR